MPSDKTIFLKKNARIKANLLKVDKVQINEAEILTLPGIFVEDKVKDNGL